MKIGIPRSLFASYHLAYWKQFITLSGMEAVLSDDSNPDSAGRGGRLLPHEFCIPVKVFIGHILNLMEKGVDQILVPRMITQGKSNYFCPKLIGLPEIVRYSTGLEKTKMFSPEVVCNGLKVRITQLPVIHSIASKKMKDAMEQAGQLWENILSDCRRDKITLPEATACRKKTKTAENGLTIGVLGYAYSLYDPLISKGILKKLNQLGVAVETWEMIDPNEIEGKLAVLKRPLFWNFGRMLLGAGLHFLKDNQIDGLIYVTTFGCGPDSVAMKILSMEAGNERKPLLSINLDEHTEDGHLNTRLEAFADILAALKEDRAI